MKKINVDKITEKIYYINVVLLVLKIYYSISEIFIIPNFISKLITLYILSTFALNLLINTYRKKYGLKTILIEYAIVFISIYSSLVSKDFNILITCFLIIGIKDVDLKKTLRIILKINAIMLLIHFVFYIITWIFNAENLVVKYNADGDKRYCFFLNNPNQLSIILFSTYSTYIYLKYENIKLMDYIIGLILCIFIYLFPKSRTSSIIAMIFIGLIAISKVDNKIIKKIIYCTSKYLFIAICIITFIFIIKFNDLRKEQFIWKIDTILSGRIWYTNLAFENYGLTLFGQNINYEQVMKYDKEIILDNFYAKMILNYGIVLLIMIATWFIYINKKLKIEDCVLVIIFSIVGVTEFHMSNACIGIALLVVGAIQNEHDNKINEKIINSINEGENDGEN